VAGARVDNKGRAHTALRADLILAALKRIRTIPGLLLLAVGLYGCAARQAPIEPVDNVDLQRFMGDWYVIASIPTFIEKEAYNAIETYELKDDGSIATTFVFRKGGFDGEIKRYHPTGYVIDEESNAVWGMQFVWPIKADYRIAWLDDDYSRTVIARNKRDFVWIMAREPSISEQDYAELVDHIASLGYDVSKIRKVPQQW
jgi:apolipoprotein D and lipocalin family protein